MRPQIFALIAATASSALLLASVPVEAQDRARTRITVQPKSYLDPGTKVQPGSMHYHRYAFPLEQQYPTFGPFAAGTGSWESSRGPLLRIFEAPGY
ncbi:MAG TPA: hypothetical protein VFY21_04820 [Xanthobacteraceae bacterium]|nr:hypothetical protein [Xanthobacteraceae bacterium]